nr:hypothetical protein [Gudongella oleilytica]
MLNTKYGDEFIAESAGLNASSIHPLAIEVMKSHGVDISGNSVNNVFDYYKEGRFYTNVVTVCSGEQEKECPIFPGVKMRLNWGLENLEDFEGSDEEKIDKAYKLVQEI